LFLGWQNRPLFSVSSWKWSKEKDKKTYISRYIVDKKKDR
jgi:ABC-type uncharacterized transport system YnjBCD permease subunit